MTTTSSSDAAKASLPALEDASAATPFYLQQPLRPSSKQLATRKTPTAWKFMTESDLLGLSSSASSSLSTPQHPTQHRQPSATSPPTAHKALALLPHPLSSRGGAGGSLGSGGAMQTPTLSSSQQRPELSRQRPRTVPSEAVDPITRHFELSKDIARRDRGLARRDTNNNKSSDDTAAAVESTDDESLRWYRLLQSCDGQVARLQSQVDSGTPYADVGAKLTSAGSHSSAPPPSASASSSFRRISWTQNKPQLPEQAVPQRTNSSTTLLRRSDSGAGKAAAVAKQKEKEEKGQGIVLAAPTAASSSSGVPKPPSTAPSGGCRQQQHHQRQQGQQSPSSSTNPAVYAAAAAAASLESFQKGNFQTMVVTGTTGSADFPSRPSSTGGGDACVSYSTVVLGDRTKPRSVHDAKPPPSATDPASCSSLVVLPSQQEQQQKQKQQFTHSLDVGVWKRKLSEARQACTVASSSMSHSSPSLSIRAAAMPTPKIHVLSKSSSPRAQLLRSAESCRRRNVPARHDVAAVEKQLSPQGSSSAAAFRSEGLDTLRRHVQKTLHDRAASERRHRKEEEWEVQNEELRRFGSGDDEIPALFKDDEHDQDPAAAAAKNKRSVYFEGDPAQAPPPVATTKEATRRTKQPQLPPKKESATSTSPTRPHSPSLPSNRGPRQQQQQGYQGTRFTECVNTEDPMHQLVTHVVEDVRDAFEFPPDENRNLQDVIDEMQYARMNELFLRYHGVAAAPNEIDKIEVTNPSQTLMTTQRKLDMQPLLRNETLRYPGEVEPDVEVTALLNTVDDDENDFDQFVSDTIERKCGKMDCKVLHEQQSEQTKLREAKRMRREQEEQQRADNFQSPSREQQQQQQQGLHGSEEVDLTAIPDEMPPSSKPGKKKRKQQQLQQPITSATRPMISGRECLDTSVAELRILGLL